MTAADFVPLADLLRTPVAALDQAPVLVTSADVPPAESAEIAPRELVASLRDARLFGARAADAFDEAVVRLLRDLAADVLGRELRLAPCELDALIARHRARLPVLRIRVAPEDAARSVPFDLVPDAALSAGDAIFEIAGGALDARLGIRLAAVLESCS